MSDDLVGKMRYFHSRNGLTDREKLTDRIEQLEAADRIQELEAALKPFADLAYESDGEMYERLAHNLEDGSFIRARKALEGKND